MFRLGIHLARHYPSAINHGGESIPAGIGCQFCPVRRVENAHPQRRAAFRHAPDAA